MRRLSGFWLVLSCVALLPSFCKIVFLRNGFKARSFAMLFTDLLVLALLTLIFRPPPTIKRARGGGRISGGSSPNDVHNFANRRFAEGGFRHCFAESMTALGSVFFGSRRRRAAVNHVTIVSAVALMATSCRPIVDINFILIVMGKHGVENADSFAGQMTRGA